MKVGSLNKLSNSIPSLWAILCVISVISISLFEYLKRDDFSGALRSWVLSIVLISISIFFMLSQQIKARDYPYFTLLIAGCFGLSNLFILVSNGQIEYHVWLFGCVLIAAIININLGYIFAFNNVFFASLVGRLSIEKIIYLLVLGVIMCMLSKYMKSLKTLIYVLVILLSTDVIMLFILHNFVLKNAFTMNALLSLIMTSIVTILVFGLNYIYEKKIKYPIELETLLRLDEIEDNTNKLDSNDSINSDLSHNGMIADKIIHTFKLESLNESIDANESMHNEPMGAITKSTEVVNESYHVTYESSLDEINRTSHPLLVRLKEHSEKLYDRALLVGELSEDAAKYIGADEKIAKAGGLYHEIGRILEKDYINDGIKLVQAYRFPQCISDIIRQYNLKYEKPKSIEAAIVMITASIVATKEYLEANAKKEGTMVTTPMSKIVDNVFTMRLSKGSLDESNLTLKQYNKLKEFFLQL